MSTEQNKALVRQFVAAADQQDFERASAFLSPDMIVHLAGAPGAVGFG